MNLPVCINCKIKTTSFLDVGLLILLMLSYSIHFSLLAFT